MLVPLADRAMSAKLFMNDDSIINRAFTMLRNVRNRDKREITIATLPDKPPSNVLLRCNVCGEDHHSARRGDYDAFPPETILKCVNCNSPLRLVYSQRVFLPFKP